MRNIYIVVCLMLLNSIAAYAQETFSAQIADENIRFSAVCKSKDGDYLLSFLDGKTGKVIAKSSPEGKIKWAKLYSASVLKTELTSCPIICTKDNGFVTASIYAKEKDSGNYIFKCDSMGKVLWQKVIDTAQERHYFYNYKITLCETELGNIYLVTSNLYLGYFNVIKLSADGKVIWNKRFSHGIDNTWLGISNVASGNNEQLIVMSTSYGCEFYCAHSNIQKIDKDGNGIWAYDLGSNLANSVSGSGLFYINNEITIICSIKLFSYDYKYGVWTFSDNGKISKAVLLDASIFSLKDYLTKKDKIPPSACVLGTSYEYLLNDDNSLLYAYGGLPNSLFYKYDSLNRICPYYALPVFDSTKKHFDFRPTIISKYKESLYKLTISDFDITTSPFTLPVTPICSGTAPLTASLNQNNITSSAKPSINFYPNPTTNTLIITGLKNKTTLQIINTNGNVLKEVTTTSSTQTINVHSLAAGAYLLRINNGEKIITKTFIKQ